MLQSRTVAGIIRIQPERLAASPVESTLAELFDTWGNAEAAQQPGWCGAINRLAGGLAGPRQHKLRANLQQIHAELDRELAGFLGSAAGE